MSHYPSFSLGQTAHHEFKVGEIVDSHLLSAEVKRHLKSRRIHRLEVVEFLNGSGTRIIAQCEDLPSFRFRIQEVKTEIALRPHIELCLPLIKHDLLAEALTQATEIGVARILWIRTEHDQVPKGLKKIPFERAQRITQAALEQCARPWSITVDEDWSSVSEILKDKSVDKIVADENLASLDKAGFTEHHIPRFDKKVLLLIGPEGGWSQTERQAFDSSESYKLGLGNLVLRVPTAIVAACFFLRFQAQAKTE